MAVAGECRVIGGLADLLSMLEQSKLALNVANFVRHEDFLHAKSVNLQEVSRESAFNYRPNVRVP